MKPPPIEPRVTYGGRGEDLVEVRIGGVFVGALAVPGGRGDEIAELLGQGMCKSRIRAIDALRRAAAELEGCGRIKQAIDARLAADIVEADIRRPEGV